MPSLDPQKNFYDEKRYFMGKDNPGDAHPEPRAGGIPRGQIIFGVIFIGFEFRGIARALIHILAPLTRLLQRVYFLLK